MFYKADQLFLGVFCYKRPLPASVCLSVPFSLPVSLPFSCPFSRPFSLTYFIPPSFPPSFPVSFPPTFPPSFPPSNPVSPSLPPSLPPSFLPLEQFVTLTWKYLSFFFHLVDFFGAVLFGMLGEFVSLIWKYFFCAICCRCCLPPGQSPGNKKNEHKIK